MAINKQRKQFLKDKKEYEKLLQKKANLGTLSFVEKEQYQSMVHSKRRNRALKKDKVAKVVISVASTIIMIIVFYIGPSAFSNPEEEVYSNNYQAIGQQQEYAHYDILIEKIDTYVLLGNETNQYFNKAIQIYNATQHVGKEELQKLEEINYIEEDPNFEELSDMLYRKREMQIDILNRLEDPKESREQLKEDCKIIESIDLKYKSQLNTMVKDQLEIDSNIQIEPINFYVAK